MAGSSHSLALVPIGSWCYSGPELRASGKRIDVGLLAEALVYYDRVLVNLPTQDHFADLLRWFHDREALDTLLGLVRDGVVGFYDYGFASTAVNKGGVYSLLNIQDPIQARPNTFEQRYLYHPEVERVLPKARQRQTLYKSVRGHVVEVKAEQFSAPIKNAQLDLENAGRLALIVQAFVDELHSTRSLGAAPDVRVQISANPDGFKQITFSNVDFNKLSQMAGPDLNWHDGTPLVAGVTANKFLWSAALLQCDLFLGSPISTLVGDKLYEGSRATKLQATIGELRTRVEFPEVRSLVNGGRLTLEEILKIRNKARRFRAWLQTEGERDRDAIIAYHHEVAEEAGIMKLGRKALHLFGVFGGAAVGAVAGLPGAMVGAGLGYLADLGARIDADWKPVVFGNWLRDRIEKHLRDR